MAVLKPRSWASEACMSCKKKCGLKYVLVVYNNLCDWVYWSESKASEKKKNVNISQMPYNPLVKLKPHVKVKWISKVGFMSVFQLICCSFLAILYFWKNIWPDRMYNRQKLWREIGEHTTDKQKTKQTSKKTQTKQRKKKK